MINIFKFNKNKIEFEVFYLEDRLKNYFKESQKGKVEYVESIDQFINNFLKRLKGILANGKMLDDLDISTLKAINEGVPFMSNVHVIPIDYLKSYSYNEGIRLDERFKEKGFQAIENVGYIRLDSSGERVINISDIVEQSNVENE